MKDMSDYKEKAEIGINACLRTIKKLNNAIDSAKFLGIDDKELKQKRQETIDRMKEIQGIKEKIDAKSN